MNKKGIISKVNADGTITAIFCQVCTEYTFAHLRNYYGTLKRISALFRLGDIRQLYVDAKRIPPVYGELIYGVNIRMFKSTEELIEFAKKADVKYNYIHYAGKWMELNKTVPNKASDGKLVKVCLEGANHIIPKPTYDSDLKGFIIIEI